MPCKSGSPHAVLTAGAFRAGVGAWSRVLDVCAGLGGPARVLAHRRGCRVVACELNHGRAAGGARLTRLVGLAGRITMVRADALALPFASASFDACLSQEGLLHIDDKAAVLAECHRVLAADGRLAFTDWIASSQLLRMPISKPSSTICKSAPMMRLSRMLPTRS